MRRSSYSTDGSPAFGSTQRPRYRGGDRFWLRDEFTTPDASPLASPRTSDGRGTLTVVQTDGTFAIADGALSWTGQTTPAWGAQSIIGPRFVRAPGTIALCQFRLSASAWGPLFGWQSVANSASDEQHSIFFAGENLFAYSGATYRYVGGYAYGTTYQVAIVLRSHGAHTLIKGGAYAEWTLLWVSGNWTWDPYLAAMHYDDAGSADWIRVAAAGTWIAAPLASDSFDRDDGALGSTDGMAAEEPGGSAVAWTDLIGVWGISGNAAAVIPTGTAVSNSATVDVSTPNVVMQCTVNLGATGSYAGVCVRQSDAVNGWEVEITTFDAVSIVENNGGVRTTRASAAATIDPSTDYPLLVVAEAGTILVSVAGGSTLGYGSASFNQLVTTHGLYAHGTAVHSTVRWNDYVVWPRVIGDFPL